MVATVNELNGRDDAKPAKCEYCRQGIQQSMLCGQCNRYHHSGRIHTPDQQVRGLCEPCAVLIAAAPERYRMGREEAA